MPRTARKTRNQVLFREVNARIADISSSLDDSIEALGLICECSQTGCTEIVEVSIPNYARARDDANLFLVKAGHENPDHEVVVESWGDYLIVQSISGPAPT
jgi:hypothetical protein